MNKSDTANPLSISIHVINNVIHTKVNTVKYLGLTFVRRGKNTFTLQI